MPEETEASELPGTGLRSGSELPERLLGAWKSLETLETLSLLCFPKERGDKEWLYSRSERRPRSSQDKFGSGRVFEGPSIHSR